MAMLEKLLTLKEAASVLDAIFGFLPTGVIVARHPDGKILRVSDFGARLLGKPRDELEGKTLEQFDELVPAYSETGQRVALSERPLHIALRGASVTGFEYWLDAADGERIPVISSASPIIEAHGDRIGAIGSITDLRPYKALEQGLREAVAQREEAILQREGLYRELTHRVKNHLQIMTALVSMDSKNPELSARELGEQMKGQLLALAAVYRGMDRAELSQSIEARAFVEEICRPYASRTVDVHTVVAPPDLTLASDQAGPVGMLVNEAVCNSRKHAFPTNGGHIQVSLRRMQPGRLRLEVADDGVGWGAIDPSEPYHGLDLMRLFAKQLHSDLELIANRPGGAVIAAEISENGRSAATRHL
jgi:PAS domain S-box-containing protein